MTHFLPDKNGVLERSTNKGLGTVDDNNDGFSDVGLIISKVLTPNQTEV
jgi:hypothetical protein